MENDRCQEDSYRLLMQCYARLGLWNKALRQYRLCERILRQTHGMAPSPETHVLYESLFSEHP
jgi:pentatricopeptide repeat protein